MFKHFKTNINILNYTTHNESNRTQFRSSRKCFINIIQLSVKSLILVYENWQKRRKLTQREKEKHSQTIETNWNVGTTE